MTSSPAPSGRFRPTPGLAMCVSSKTSSREP
jgi:hypothetical protein